MLLPHLVSKHPYFPFLPFSQQGQHYNFWLNQFKSICNITASKAHNYYFELSYIVYNIYIFLLLSLVLPGVNNYRSFAKFIDVYLSLIQPLTPWKPWKFPLDTVKYIRYSLRFNSFFKSVHLLTSPVEKLTCKFPSPSGWDPFFSLNDVFTCFLPLY